MRDWRWSRIFVGALLALGGVSGLLVLEGTAWSWPVVVLGVVLVASGMRFSFKDWAWALMLLLGLALIVAGIAGQPVVFDIDLSAITVFAGSALFSATASP